MEIRKAISQLEEQCWLLEKEMALLIRKRKQLEALNSAKNKLHEEKTKVKIVEEDVAKVVSLWCGVPITQMSQDETEKYKVLESIITQTCYRSGKCSNSCFECSTLRTFKLGSGLSACG